MSKKDKEQASSDAPQAYVGKNKIGIKEAIGYCLGDAGNTFNLTYVSSYLKMFMTDVLKISPKRTGFMFIISRLWDCINDPIWGGIVAKRKPSKGGKFRPYLLWVSVPLSLSLFLCFCPWFKLTSNQTILLVISYITYILYGMMYTGMNVPYGSLASVMTDDPGSRTLLSTFRSIGSGIGGGVVSLLAPIFIFKKTGQIDAVTGTEVKATDGNRMFAFGVAMAILSLVFYLLSYFTTKERVPSEADPKVDMKKTFKTLFTSRPFITVALAGVLISGQLQFNSFNTYLYKNYFSNTNLSILGTVCQYAPTVILIFFMPKLVAKYGKKELCGSWSIMSAIGAVVLAFAANSPTCIKLLNHGSADGIFPAWLFMVIQLIIGFGYTFISLTCWAVVMDVIDYQEVTTGLRNESATYAVYTFSRKFGQTLADAAGLFLLQWAKYDSNTAGIGFITENGTSKKIMLICTIIPAIVYTGVWALMRFGYPLTKERLEPIYQGIKEIREREEKEGLLFGGGADQSAETEE